MLHMLIAFLLCLGAAWTRDTTKAFKSMPTISNSLVNLGKMDISFHFNTKFPDLSSLADGKSDSFFFSKSEPTSVQEPCHCSGFKNMKTPFLNNPSELINKILMNNDLFSYNKDPVTSINCCESHEHVQEDTLFFELGPKQNHAQLNSAQQNSLPIFPFVLDNLIPNKPSLPTMPVKPKAIEIFFFPKKKEMPSYEIGKTFPKKKLDKKLDIQIVGDKELKNDFKSLKYRPSLPVSSIKKDLASEKIDKETTLETTEEPVKVTVTVNQSNSV